ncbi:MAG: Holliday junction branch migration DNA helicase RuvB, partial [Panacagrimonas sp.]
MVNLSRPIEARATDEDGQLEHRIRPQSLADYVGQPRVREQMGIAI